MCPVSGGGGDGPSAAPHYSNHSRRQLQMECSTGEGGLEGVEDRAALLAPGGADRAKAAEGIGTGVAAEGARDLLLDFDHAQVPLRLIVVEGHGEVLEEQERLMFIHPEPVEQVAGRALLTPPAPRLASGRRLRILGEALG